MPDHDEGDEVMDKKTRRILECLAVPREDRRRPHDYTEDELPRASHGFLRAMYYAGLIGLRETTK
jgi:hypothetical protein